MDCYFEIHFSELNLYLLLLINKKCDELCIHIYSLYRLNGVRYRVIESINKFVFFCLHR